MSGRKLVAHGRPIVFLSAVLLLFLSGCRKMARETPRTMDTSLCSIVIESGEHYSVFGYAQQVERGTDISFTVKLTGNNLIESVDYPDYTVANGEVASVDGVNYQTLTLHNVRYSTAISITTYQPYPIRYHANGGTWASTNDETIEISASLSHLRQNTALGIGQLTHIGYTQIGWNTRPDGSGLSVGQGSRIDTVEGERPELYAQWSQWTAEKSFSYVVNNGGATITAWHGEAGALSIPAVLGGWPVRSIQAEIGRAHV